MVVDYEGSLARRVAGDVWTGLSRAALEGEEGYVKTTALWDSLRERSVDNEAEREVAVRIFVLEQGLPEAVDELRVGKEECLYGLVMAVPEHPSPLAGSLLYQGVERLKEGGVKAGSIEPALLRADLKECERYAGKLIERLKIER